MKTTRSHLLALGRPLLLAALVIGGGLALVSTGRAQEDAPEQAPGEFRAAVLNVDQILRDSQEWQDDAQQRASMAERAERVLKPLDRQRRASQRAVHDYPIGTEERREAEKAAREKELEYQRKRAELDAEMKQQFADSYRNIMSKISTAAGEYAKANGVQMVLKVGSPTDLDNQRDLLDVHMQQVVYAAPGLDISQEVVKMLNAEYEAPIEDN